MMRDLDVPDQPHHRGHVDSRTFGVEATWTRRYDRRLLVEDEHDGPASADHRNRLVRCVQNECAGHPDLLRTAAAPYQRKIS